MKMLFHEQDIEGVVNTIHLSEPEIYVDNEKRGRSGHIGHGLVEFAPGKIMAFNSNVSDKKYSGHSTFGWVEYRISEDYGKTWGEIQNLPYSVEEFYDGVHNVSVEKAVVCDDGTIVAFCLMNSPEKLAEPWDNPRYVTSKDSGKTWSESKEVSPYKGRIYDALYYNGAIYVLEFCNDAAESFTGNSDEHLYRIFKSDDNGGSFYELSVVGFPETISRAYGNMIFTPEGRLMVYAYNVSDENNMDCVISDDCGKTWGNYTKCYLENKIRNPQVNILDGQYILHGRAGESEAGTGSFVFYTSKDGLVWDEGTILVKNRPACFYSNNLVVKCPDNKERMLVQYSENYNDPIPGVWNAQVNVMHLWIETKETDR